MKIPDRSDADAPATGPKAGRMGALSGREGLESFHHSMKRRCFVHDYKGRSIYLITLEVAGRRRLLGRIMAPEGIPLSVSELSEEELSAANDPLFEPSELGRRVAEEFMKIGEHVPGVKPLLAQVMPDHVHGILFVTRDNPRRLAIRLKCPDLFTSVRCLAGHGRSSQAFGNGFLLQCDTIAQVQCSRSFFGFRREMKRDQSGTRIARDERGEGIVAFETADYSRKKEELFSLAKKGTVLCSPCISDGEKAIAYAAVDAGYPLIVLRPEPFPPRFKPSGRFFDACAEGRLLILCPEELMRPMPDGRERRITRGECLALNGIVAQICGGSAELQFLIAGVRKKE